MIEQFIYPTIYIVTVYFLTNQPWDVTRFFLYFGMGVMTSLVAQSVGVLLGAGLNLQVKKNNNWIATVFSFFNTHYIFFFFRYIQAAVFMGMYHKVPMVYTVISALHRII